jgi:hypothetical protein
MRGREKAKKVVLPSIILRPHTRGAHGTKYTTTHSTGNRGDHDDDDEFWGGGDIICIEFVIKVCLSVRFDIQSAERDAEKVVADDVAAPLAIAD